MNTFRIMLGVELKRMRNGTTLAIPFLLLVLSLLLAALEARFSPSFIVPRFFLNTVASLSLALAGPLLGAGMLSHDLTSHWARTTLMRPVTRVHFVMARIGAVYLFAAATIVINAWVPIPIAGLISGKEIVLRLSESLPMFILFLMHLYLIIVLLTLLSCWLPGIMNIVVLGAWAIAGSLFEAYVRAQQWDSGILTLLSDFIFPSGFLDAARILGPGGHELWANIIWGIAASAGFTALTFWAFNRVTIETGSE